MPYKIIVRVLRYRTLSDEFGSCFFSDEFGSWFFSTTRKVRKPCDASTERCHRDFFQSHHFRCAFRPPWISEKLSSLLFGNLRRGDVLFHHPRVVRTCTFYFLWYLPYVYYTMFIASQSRPTNEKEPNNNTKAYCLEETLRKLGWEFVLTAAGRLNPTRYTMIKARGSARTVSQ